MLRLSWFISIGISLFGVMIIQYFFALEPGDVEKGGNLGAFGIALVSPFLLLSLFTTYRYFSTLSRNARNHVMRLAFILLGILFVSIITNYAIDYKNEVYEALGGTTKDPQSTIYGYPLLNQYTNQVFLNFYTFTIVHGIIALLASCIGIFQKPQPVVLDDKKPHIQ